MKIGDVVRHRNKPEFGLGRVNRIYPDGYVQVIFPNATFSWLEPSYFIPAEEEMRLLREAEEKAKQEEKAKRVEEVRKKVLLQRILTTLESDFLSADEYLQQDPDRELLADKEFLELKSRFVQEWSERILNQSLDAQQAEAVASTGGDIRVVARAGAGKTRTLITRALFLQKHCGVSPRALLLLAFNKAAALEMRERLSKALEGDVPHVMTFHALAYALVEYLEEDIIYDEPSVGDFSLSREIQQVIDEHLQSEQYRPLIRALMLKHFRDDWERIVKGGFHLSISELIEHRNLLPRETLKGDYVKSYGEKLIANTLFQHDIEYKYERNYRWNGVNYRPDFTILLPESRLVVIEYFGLKGDLDYDESAEQKRQFWDNHERGRLIEFLPADITSLEGGGFEELLLKRLNEAGVTGHRLSEEALWERIRRRAIDKFTGAIKSFVSRCRKKNLSTDEVHHMIDQHSSITESERLFLEVGASVYSGYVQRLKAAKQEDFDGLMWRAVALLKEGQSHFVRDRGRERGDLQKIRFVLIDEFQDFSKMFYSLSQGIRSLSSSVEFFCVGDDWQSINGFAGSDLEFFEHFKRWFRSTTTCYVRTNYRSPNQVVQLGNALMVGCGEPAVPHRADAGWVRTAHLSEFTPSVLEQDKHNGDEGTPAVLRLVKHLLNSGRDIVMLSRRHDVPWYVNYVQSKTEILDRLEHFADHIRSFLPEEDRKRITTSTAHQYKGLEKDAVVVLDANQGSYPLIHPNWVFLRIFGDSIERIEAEERRLFYVALTRSKHSLVILSNDPKSESPYLRDIKMYMALDSISWPSLTPMPSLDGTRLEVRVSNAYNIRDRLKELGYRWNNSGRYWYRSVIEQDFDATELFSQSWVQSGVHVEIYSEQGELLKLN
jgi:DNA helicase-4